MFDILIYSYHLFYKNLLKDDTPIATTLFAVSASTAIIICTFVNIVLVTLRNSPLETIDMMLVFLVVFVIIVYKYGYMKRAKMITVSLKVKRINILFALFYFIFSILCLFFGPIIRSYIEQGYY